jgi:hypothetical protein
VERAGQIEDHFAALPGDHSAGGERAPVADHLDVVYQRDVDPAGQQKVGVQRVQHPGDHDRTRRRDQRLRQHLAAEHPLQLGVRLAGPEQPDFDFLQIEQVDELGHRLGHGLRLLGSARASSASVGIARRRAEER